MNVLRNFFSGRKYKFLCFPDFEQKTFGNLANKFSADLSKLQSTCPYERFKELLFLKKLKIFLVSKIWAYTFLSFGKDFRQVSQTCKLRLMRNVLWIKSFAKLKFCLVLFGLCAKTCRIFDKKNSGELSKLHSTCPDERFEELFFWEKVINFYGVNTLIEKPSEFWRRFSASFSNLQFTSHEERFVEWNFWKE